MSNRDTPLVIKPDPALAPDVEDSGDSPQPRLEAVASISHELRAPLHAITGLAELLLERDLPDRERALALGIRRESDALRVIVDDLLDLAKIEAGRMEVHMQTMAPRSLIDETLSMYQPQAIDKGLEINVAISDDLPRSVRCDRHRLRQILINLVSNAVKYTAEGSVTIDASADDSHLHFRVADTGPGFPDEALPEIFQPFRQARERDRSKGTGLGLSVTHQLVELLGGSLDLSTSTQGTTFTMAIPYEAVAVADEIASGPTRDTTGSFHVLVVDDTEVNRLVATSQLERLGHTAAEAPNGLDALAMLESQVFDLILMDWHMPGLDGFETTAEYFAAANEHGRPAAPVVMMTASVSAEARSRCLDAGFADFLPKPVSVSDLAECLDRCLSTPASHALPLKPDATEQPTLDRSVIDTMVRDLGGPAPVRMVIETFLSDAAVRRHDVHVDDDPALARRAAHTLKSTAAMLGAIPLSETCGSLEALLADDDADSDEAAVSALRERFDAQLDELIAAMTTAVADLADPE